jgi:hypothetical protein
MAQVKCIRDCYVKGFLYRRGNSYDIDPQAGWAKFFDFPPAPAPQEPAKKEDESLKVTLENLKKENASLKK